MRSKLYITKLINGEPAEKPFRIIERIHTIDGERDRITGTHFGSLAEAQAFVDKMDGKDVR